MSKRADFLKLDRLSRNRDVIQLRGPNGAGSSGTRIRRFASIVRAYGKSITYNADATNGDSFIINQTGLYIINCSDARSPSASDVVGLSLNSSTLSTNYSSLTTAEQLGHGIMISADNPGWVVFVGMLEAGDTVRVHLGAAASDSGNVFATRFYMARIL